MTRLAGLGLRLRIFLFFAAMALGSLGALVLGLVLGYRHAGGGVALSGFVQAGVVAGFAILGLIAWIWTLFDTHVAKPIDILSGAMRARTHADVSGEIDGATARHLGDLAPAATATAKALTQTRDALAQAVARETSRLANEKSRLETLLADVPVGVVLCSPDHQLAFYNGHAALLMATPGLDRNLFDYLHSGPILLAHQRLIEIAGEDAVTDLLCTTVAGGRVLAARMRLTAREGGRAGYVLTLRDVTADQARHARREALLSQVLDRARRSAGNLQSLTEALPEAANPLERALRDEISGLTAAVRELTRRQDESRNESAMLTVTRASDLAQGVCARLQAAGLAASPQAAELLLRCNGYQLIMLLSDLGLKIAEAGLAKDFTLSVEEEEGGAMIRLAWAGEALTVGRLEGWLAAPVDGGESGLAIVAGHASEIWPQVQGGQASVCLPLRQARRAVPRPAPIHRAVVYDFDLMSRARSEKVADTPLQELTYVVFDTETTGLFPDQGDEIVQIAALRIVGGRLVQGEVFDTLVNPRRVIPASSTAVHGISNAMVADAPGFDEVARNFHRFVDGAVLIAHNAPFDMQFLRRIEPAIGLKFDNPVLDTVLLSAVVYGQHETHTLDALAHRLGLSIPEEMRHTALGDTVATADAFLKLMPMLRGRGLETFGQVVGEVRKHGRLLKDLN